MIINSYTIQQSILYTVTAWRAHLFSGMLPVTQLYNLIVIMVVTDDQICPEHLEGP